MTGRKSAVTVEHTDRSAFFAGAARHQLTQAAQRAGSPSQWSNGRHALGIPIQHAAEVEAYLVASGFSVWTMLPAVSE